MPWSEIKRMIYKKGKSCNLVEHNREDKTQKKYEVVHCTKWWKHYDVLFLFLMNSLFHLGAPVVDQVID